VTAPARPPIDATPPVIAAGLRVAVVLALVAAAIGAVSTGEVSRIAGAVAIVVIVSAPLLRVLALSAWWWRIGDRRYALMGAALLAIIAIGAAIASF
jgi:hypothetical protein